MLCGVCFQVKLSFNDDLRIYLILPEGPNAKPIPERSPGNPERGRVHHKSSIMDLGLPEARGSDAKPYDVIHIRWKSVRVGAVLRRASANYRAFPVTTLA